MPPKRSLGQNFLISDVPCQTMAKELELKKEDSIIEIGPGKGALTKILLEEKDTTHFDYLGVEKDDELFSYLKQMFPTDDFTHTDILNYLRKPNRNFNKAVGSLPYNIATSIINQLCKLESPPHLCVFLVQYEFGIKLSGSESLNHIAAFVQGFYNVQEIKKVKRTLFFPIPKVDGIIIKLDYKHTTIDPYKYEKFIKRFFSQPRKMINKAFSKTDLDVMKLEGSKRPSEFTMEQIITAYFNLSDKSPLRAS